MFNKKKNEEPQPEEKVVKEGDDGKEKEQVPTMILELNDDGSVKYKCNMQNKVLMVWMLENTKNAVLNPKSSPIVKAHEGDNKNFLQSLKKNMDKKGRVH